MLSRWQKKESIKAFKGYLDNALDDQGEGITSRKVSMRLRIGIQGLCSRCFKGYLLCWLCTRQEKNP